MNTIPMLLNPTSHRTIIQRLCPVGALLLSLLLAACAKQGYPEGGPVDRTPPEVLSTLPESGTRNFSEKEFSIIMDEYVNIKDANNNILVSPPMKEKPEYIVRGRKIVVRINDTLLPNTTYLFQFKGGIVDFNEGNALPSFEYVFSTGNEIDSMTIQGQVLDAFTLKPSKETVSVLAYVDTVDDSCVVNGQPLYYTRCDTAGLFAFNHMRPGSYRVVAFVDADRNLQLAPSEPVAFLGPESGQTIKAESGQTVNGGQPVRFYLSQKNIEVQRVDKSLFVSTGHFQITTKQPLSSLYRLQHLMADTSLQLYPYLGAKGDTLDCWLSIGSLDSVVVVLSDTDFTDTLRLRQTYSKRQDSSKEPYKQLTVKGPTASLHHYYDTLRLSLSNPVHQLDTTLWVIVMNQADSTMDSCRVHLGLAQDSGVTATRTAQVLFAGSPGSKYHFTLPEGLFTDIYGNKSDSLSFTSQYSKQEDYGTISLTIESERSPLLVQLLNEKGDAVRQERLAKAGKVSFIHLREGKYTFRLVVDANGDGQWTPGDYWEHRQPEEVIYMEKVLDLRANWEITERFHW